MTDKTTPAFPTTKPLESWGDPNQGMSLRDYFAAKAMQSFMAWPIAGRIEATTDAEIYAAWAASSYQVADAMLKAREAV